MMKSNHHFLLVASAFFFAAHCWADDALPPCLSISNGPLSVSIAPSVGGRVASFAYKGKEILRTDRDANHWQWGSTVWTSPQTDWNWPPPAILDQEDYKVTAHDANLIEVVSKIDPTTKLQLTKRAEFIQELGSVSKLRLTYRILNRGQALRKVALWENTRVNWEGSVEFPDGGNLRQADSQQPMNIQHRDTSLHIVFDDAQPHGQKLFYTPSDQSNTLWTRYHANGLVLTKACELPGLTAPGQAPLEIYLAPKEGFAELEYQGEYMTLQPGEAATLVVTWTLVPREN